MTDLGILPTPVPQVAPDTAAFWAATGRHVLLLQHCTNCQTAIWYPRYLCPACHSTNLENVEASGYGRVYSVTLTSRGILEYKECGPYLLALVELDEGPMMMTNLVDCDPDQVAIGQRVRVVFQDTGAGSALPRFAPVIG